MIQAIKMGADIFSGSGGVGNSRTDFTHELFLEDLLNRTALRRRSFNRALPAVGEETEEGGWVMASGHLEQYNYRLQFTPGRDNVVVDLLSRSIPSPPSAPPLAPERDQAEHDLFQLLHTPLQETASLRELQDASADDPALSTLSTSIRQGWPARVPGELLPYSRIRDGLSCWNDTCVAHRLCTVVPSALRTRILAMAHQGHLGIIRLKQRCRDVAWWPGIAREIETLVKDCTACLLSGKPRPHPLGLAVPTLGAPATRHLRRAAWGTASPAIPRRDLRPPLYVARGDTRGLGHSRGVD
ncbi:hypothetical protein SKAU_G00240200 [Synaphobranchus kaupii]|uniref:Gypsy retrotransposon integrase-like protein 1 n=1 Tax=Synaphobranchus kaupii TaxID=118154 RepID=A0A9Q1F7V6_SYNKA|nr:hypothetical protein SKAU_G00240200 [Synaphobranchus kaupii]